VDWVLYAPDSSLVDKRLSDSKIQEMSVIPETSGEVMFNALCRRQPRER